MLLDHLKIFPAAGSVPHQLPDLTCTCRAGPPWSGEPTAPPSFAAAASSTPLLLDTTLEARLRRQFDELARRQQMIAELSREADGARLELAKVKATAAAAASDGLGVPKDKQAATLLDKLRTCEVRTRLAPSPRKVPASHSVLELKR